jgi:hypothetical protein
VSSPGGDEDHDDELMTGVREHRRRSNPLGTERLLAREVDEDLTEVLFGETVEPPTSDS